MEGVDVRPLLFGLMNDPALRLAADLLGRVEPLH